ncbi:MAG TPA: hypothetical protein VGG39_37405 [Polyangiaceae bacterium]
MREFKILCDGLLRAEMGSLVQTFASDGTDGGIDAQYRGTLDGILGRWVFQYKFRSPDTSTRAARVWLKSRYVRDDKSEFDKDGVRGANGYILLTNISVTVSLVEKLAQAWKQREPAGAFCVWDPSRLNVLLKDNEHLARSWSGAKEAHCWRAIVSPLWQWLHDHVPIHAAWIRDPMWPWLVRSHQQSRSLGTFRLSVEPTFVFDLLRHDQILDAVRADPQFPYASTIVYPRAMGSFRLVRRAVNSLAEAVATEIQQLRDELLGHLPQLAEIADEARRAEVARLLSFCVLEGRWGFPARGLHDIRDGILWVNGVESLPNVNLEGALPFLNELVGSWQPHGAVPPRVRAARNAVVKALRRWRESLWFAFELGIDAEETAIAVARRARADAR